MNDQLSRLVIGGYLGLMVGCSAVEPVNTFRFTADLPPSFSYQAIAVYVPAEGETCTVPGRKNTAVGFNLEWREVYEPKSEIALYRTVSDCPLVIRQIKLEINSAYGKTRRDFSADNAGVAIRYKLDDKYINSFNEAGESNFYGQCQWLFRTSGKTRILRKILRCTSTDEKGKLGFSKPFAGYTLDQLPGKTVRMNIKLADEERPYMGDTWVKFPNGWKRCMGENFEDQHAFCFGNHTDFSGYQTHDGKQCTIYPGCTE
ncbi:hypothetical protein ACQR3P_17695 [Rhodococcus sp. IEGM1300]